MVVSLVENVNTILYNVFSFLSGKTIKIQVGKQGSYDNTLM